MRSFRFVVTVDSWSLLWQLANTRPHSPSQPISAVDNFCHRNRWGFLPFESEIIQVSRLLNLAGERREAVGVLEDVSASWVYPVIMKFKSCKYPHECF